MHSTTIIVLGFTLHLYFLMLRFSIKTQSCVSGQESMWHTSLLYTGTANLLFLTPCISITTRPIYIKFTFLCPPYTRLYIRTKFEENRPSNSRDKYS